jgi:TonB family protein
MIKRCGVQVKGGSVGSMASVSVALAALLVVGAVTAQPVSEQAQAQEGIKDGIAATVRAERQTLMRCYDEALKAAPTLEGTLTVAFSVNAAGEVTSAAAQDSSLGDDALEACVIRTLSGWRFPPRPGAEPLSVAYPFRFSPD